MRELLLLLMTAGLIACAAPGDTRLSLTSEPIEYQCPETPGKMSLKKFMGALSECADEASR